MTSIWTGERTEQLKKLWADGLSCAQIAADLGIGRNAVIGKIHRLKLPQPADKAPYYIKGQKQMPIPRGQPRSFGKAFQPQRRNPSHNIEAKIAIAASEPGNPEELKGEAPDGTGVQISGLTELNCHWPKGDPKTPDFEFCGAKAIHGLPYCAGHCRLAYQSTYRLDRADELFST
jgi:GcrA cell cycle regulator